MQRSYIGRSVEWAARQGKERGTNHRIESTASCDQIRASQVRVHHIASEEIDHSGSYCAVYLIVPTYV